MPRDIAGLLVKYNRDILVNTRVEKAIIDHPRHVGQHPNQQTCLSIAPVESLNMLFHNLTLSNVCSPTGCSGQFVCW